MRRPSLRSVQKVDALDGAATKFRALAQASFHGERTDDLCGAAARLGGRHSVGQMPLVVESFWRVALFSLCSISKPRFRLVAATFENSAKTRVLTGGA